MKHKDRKLDEKRMMHSMSLSLLGSSACTGSRFHFSLVVGCGVLDIMKHFLQAVNLKKDPWLIWFWGFKNVAYLNFQLMSVGSH